MRELDEEHFANEATYFTGGDGPCANCGRSFGVHWLMGNRYKCPPKKRFEPASPERLANPPFRVTDTRAAFQADRSRIVQKRGRADYPSDTAMGSLSLAARDTQASLLVLVFGAPMWVCVAGYLLGPLRNHEVAVSAALAAGAFVWWLAWWKFAVGVRVPSIWEAAAGLVVCAMSLPLLLVFGRKQKPTTEELAEQLVALEAELAEADRVLRREQ